MRGDLSQAPVAIWPENRLLHPGKIEEVLKVSRAELRPQRRCGRVIRHGDHRAGLRRLSARQISVLVERQAKQCAENRHFHDAGRVELLGVVEPAARVRCEGRRPEARRWIHGRSVRPGCRGQAWPRARDARTTCRKLAEAVVLTVALAGGAVSNGATANAKAARATTDANPSLGFIPRPPKSCPHRSENNGELVRLRRQGHTLPSAMQCHGMVSTARKPPALVGPAVSAPPARSAVRRTISRPRPVPLVLVGWGPCWRGAGFSGKLR